MLDGPDGTGGGAHDGAELPVEQHRRQVGVVEQVLELPLHVAVVDVHRHGRELERGQHPFDELGPVEELQTDVIARPHAQRAEAMSELVRPLVEGPVGQAAPRCDQRHSLGDHIGDALEQLAEVVGHRRLTLLINPLRTACVGWTSRARLSLGTPHVERGSRPRKKATMTVPDGIHYQSWGEGPPVLALHGLGLESSSFTGLARGITELGLQMMAADLPGFGLTPAPEAPLSPEVLARPVLELAARLDSKPLVMGMSLGARVALEAALLEPDLFRGVVTMAAPLPRRKHRQILRRRPPAEP